MSLDPLNHASIHIHALYQCVPHDIVGLFTLHDTCIVHVCTFQNIDVYTYICMCIAIDVHNVLTQLYGFFRYREEFGLSLPEEADLPPTFDLTGLVGEITALGFLVKGKLKGLPGDFTLVPSPK